MKNNYKDYLLSKGGKELGFLWSDIQKSLLTPDQYSKFVEFMRGQTCGVIGELSDEYISIVYTCDYENFINGRNNLD